MRGWLTASALAVLTALAMVPAHAAGEALSLGPLRRMLAGEMWAALGAPSEIRGSALGVDLPYYAALCAALECGR